MRLVLFGRITGFRSGGVLGVPSVVSKMPLLVLIFRFSATFAPGTVLLNLAYDRIVVR